MKISCKMRALRFFQLKPARLCFGKGSKSRGSVSGLRKTTVPKAKELRRVVEPMITLAKVDTVANRRLAFNRLRNRAIVTKLFEVLGPRFANRNGGYTRILKMGYRVGDNAPMAYMELTERAEAVEEVKEEKAAE